MIHPCFDTCSGLAHSCSGGLQMKKKAEEEQKAQAMAVARGAFTLHDG